MRFVRPTPSLREQWISGLGALLLGAIAVVVLGQHKAHAQQVAPNAVVMATFGYTQVVRVTGKDHSCYVVTTSSMNAIGISCVK